MLIISDLMGTTLSQSEGKKPGSLLAERDVEIEQLRAQIDKLRRMQFGRKPE
ncbi:hypothetical protein P3T21_004486 [Paraburkholderia sp. GAS334]